MKQLIQLEIVYNASL